MVNRNHVGLLNIHLFSKRYQTLLQRKLTHQKHLALYVHIIKVLNNIKAYTRVFQLTTLSPRLDLPGFWPGTETKREAWLLRTWFDRPIPPVNKLVSLTWLFVGTEKFSEIYITLHWSPQSAFATYCLVQLCIILVKTFPGTSAGLYADVTVAIWRSSLCFTHGDSKLLICLISLLVESLQP